MLYPCRRHTPFACDSGTCLFDSFVCKPLNLDKDFWKALFVALEVSRGVGADT